jgi:hypothetical protein
MKRLYRKSGIPIKKMTIPAKTIIQAKSLGMAKPLTGATVSDIPLSIKFS